MTYTITQPSPTQNISDGQITILNNFIELNKIFGSDAQADHYEWNNSTAALRGLHKQVTFPNTAPVPPVAPINPDPTGFLYTKVAANIPDLTFLSSVGNLDFSHFQTYVPVVSVVNGVLGGPPTASGWFGSSYGMTFAFFTSSFTLQNNPAQTAIASVSLPKACVTKGCEIIDNAGLAIDLFGPTTTLPVATNSSGVVLPFTVTVLAIYS